MDFPLSIQRAWGQVGDPQVVFKAFWLSDFAMMSMDGSVSFHDFTTNLVKDPKALATVEVGLYELTHTLYIYVYTYIYTYIHIYEVTSIYIYTYTVCILYTYYIIKSINLPVKWNLLSNVLREYTLFSHFGICFGPFRSFFGDPRWSRCSSVRWGFRVWHVRWLRQGQRVLPRCAAWLRIRNLANRYWSIEYTVYIYTHIHT
jgi:hypothetical protein